MVLARDAAQSRLVEVGESNCSLLPVPGCSVDVCADVEPNMRGMYAWSVHGNCCGCPAVLQIKAERASIEAKHATALHDLQRLPCFLRLLAQVILQVGLICMRRFVPSQPVAA